MYHAMKNDWHFQIRFRGQIFQFHTSSPACMLLREMGQDQILLVDQDTEKKRLMVF